MPAYPNPRSLAQIQADLAANKNIDEPQIFIDILTALAFSALGQPAVARQLAAGATSASTALTSTCRRISIRATGASIRYRIGTGTQIAGGTSHLIAQDERLDLAVPADAQIGIIRAASTDGVLELTELA
jgi:hypothetical protein